MDARAPLRTQARNHVVYDRILMASAHVKWRTKADAAAKCERMTQPWSVGL